MLGRAARRDVLGQPVRVVVVEPVRGDARRVTDALGAGLGGLLEHAARAVDVELARGVARRSRIAKARWTTTSAPLTSAAHAACVGHVALAVLGLLQPRSAGSNGPPRHADDPLHRARALERVDDADAEVAGRTGHRDREAGGRHGAVLSDTGGGARARRCALPLAAVRRMSIAVGVDACRAAGPQLDAVAPACRSTLDRVVAGAAVDRVRPGPAGHLVVAVPVRMRSLPPPPSTVYRGRRCAHDVVAGAGVRSSSSPPSE